MCVSFLTEDFNGRRSLLARVPSRQGSIRLAVASRSPIEGAARGILRALGIRDMFCCVEIHRGSKATHFKVWAALYCR